MVGKLELVEPDIVWEAAFFDMAADYAAAGEDRYQLEPELVNDDFVGYIRYLRRVVQGIGLGADRVPWSTFWTVRDSITILGVVRLRHRLTPTLQIEGGHIGYDIRPSERNKGYGTAQLALTLEKAREWGLQQVLVTCDTDNLPSARIIRKNGGVFDGENISPFSGKPVSRYWISTSKQREK
jgi:predicted acetyltransferase